MYAPAAFLKHFFVCGCLHYSCGMHHEIISSLQSLTDYPYTKPSCIKLQCYKTYRIHTLVINIKSILMWGLLGLTPLFMSLLHFTSWGVITNLWM